MRYISLVFTLLILVVLTGCVYEDLPLQDDGATVRPGDPMTLTFTVGVPAMGTDGSPKTRAIYYGNPEYYEDWIDTQDGLRVLFFLHRREVTGAGAPAGQYDDDNPKVAVDPQNPMKDYFLFESTSRWATQLPYDDDGNLRYQVTVPLYRIGNEESEYQDKWETIRELLRTCDFKIAILANHPECFTWTLENSVLSAPDINNLKGLSKLKTINDIHHSVGDKNYATGGSGRQDGYQMLVDNKNKINGLGTMGPFIDWVIMRSQLYGDALGGTFSDQETARTWIRDRWRPDIKYNEDNDPDIEYEALYHNYRHIWSYWNFGGAAADNGLPYSDKSRINTHINEWEVRNGALLREWVTTAYEKNSGNLTNLSTASNDEGKYDGSMPLTLRPSAATAVITSGSSGKRFYGVKLPKLSSAPSSTSASDCFYFKLNAKGTITVRYSGGTLTLKAGSSTTNGSTTSKTINGMSMTEMSCNIDLNGDNAYDCYLYSTNGEPVVYDIEVTQDQYIYLTDREGILPSSDHPIPMYGIQKYDKLEGFWDEDASFDLTGGGADSEGNPYKAKTIFLLRAVAKIEVKIPKSIGVPKHVYMRSLNRNVRCEPMDVSTPTDEIWKDHDNGCEWEMIQQHGTFYNNGFSKDAYKKHLTWYYGTWLEWGWNFNGYSSYVPNESTGPFPRVMNPYINRSDYAAFIDVTDYYNDEYYHFLFYMGENTLDASSQYNGDGGSIMVPHVEIRFDARYTPTSKMASNNDLNLTDNDCYRIYFTPGGIAPGARDANGASKIPYNQYASQYENKAEYIRQHWPIMRNHVYRFTVKDAAADKMHGLVVDAQDRRVDFDFQ